MGTRAAETTSTARRSPRARSKRHRATVHRGARRGGDRNAASGPRAVSWDESARRAGPDRPPRGLHDADPRARDAQASDQDRTRPYVHVFRGRPRAQRASGRAAAATAAVDRFPARAAPGWNDHVSAVCFAPRGWTDESSAGRRNISCAVAAVPDNSKPPKRGNLAHGRTGSHAEAAAAGLPSFVVLPENGPCLGTTERTGGSGGRDGTRARSRGRGDCSARFLGIGLLRGRLEGRRGTGREKGSKHVGARTGPDGDVPRRSYSKITCFDSRSAAAPTASTDPHEEGPGRRGRGFGTARARSSWG